LGFGRVNNRNFATTAIDRWIECSRNHRYLILMSFSPTMPALNAKWDDLSIRPKPDAARLDRMATQLDLVEIALESLGKVTPTAAIRTARDLQLESMVSGSIDEWQQREQNPSHRRTHKPSVTGIKALVLILADLAHQHQDSIRAIVAGWQKTVGRGEALDREPMLADYIQDFSQIYRQRLEESTHLDRQHLDRVALKLLSELLYYSSDRGHQYLWNALLHRSLN
jgi:hypothetical protein